MRPTSPAPTPRARPAKPTGLAVASKQDKKATLSWSTSNTATKWQYSKDGGSTWTTVTTGIEGANRTYEATGLTNGTEYAFKVRGLNQYDEPGPGSDAVKATPRLPAPTGLTAAPGDTIVAFTWNNPNDATITHYEYRPSGTKVWSTVPVSGPGTTSFTVRNLINGVAFTFYLRAVSAGDRGLPASITTAAAHKPNPPIDLAAAAGNGQVTLSWTEPNNSTITHWQYRVAQGNVTTALTASPSSLTFTTANYDTAQTMNVKLPSAPTKDVRVTLYQDGVDFTPRTFTFTTVNWNTAQDVSVKLNAAASKTVSLAQGYSPNVILDWTNVKTAVTASPASLTFTTTNYGTAQTMNVTLPAAPADDVKVTLAQDGVEFTPSSLTFTTTTWNTAQSVSVKLTAAANKTVSLAEGDLASATSVAVTSGLNNGVRYTFAVRAVNTVGGAGPFREVSATPQRLPSKPALAAVAGDTEVTLRWNRQGSFVTKHQWQQRTKTGNTWDAWGTTWTDRSFLFVYHTVTGLTNGTEYQFRVRGVSAAGNGPASDPVAATPAAPAAPLAPTGLTIRGGDKQAVLSWNLAGGPDHHPLRVPLQDHGQLPGQLDGDTVQQPGHGLPHRHGADQRHVAHLPAAGGEPRGRRRSGNGAGNGHARARRRESGRAHDLRRQGLGRADQPDLDRHVARPGLPGVADPRGRRLPAPAEAAKRRRQETSSSA